jgi:DNA-binding MarR family transcriptional regulator
MTIETTQTNTAADPFADDANVSIGANRVWFNLLRAERYLAPRIGRALKDIGIADPIWFEIMLQVNKAMPDGLPMGDLEARLHVSQYALSRHAGRMADAGLLQRQPRQGRGRGLTLHLSPTGISAIDDIWKAYETAIQSEIGSKLTPDEAYALTRLLMRLTP